MKECRSRALPTTKPSLFDAVSADDSLEHSVTVHHVVDAWDPQSPESDAVPPLPALAFPEPSTNLMASPPGLCPSRRIPEALDPVPSTTTNASGLTSAPSPLMLQTTQPAPLIVPLPPAVAPMQQTPPGALPPAQRHSPYPYQPPPRPATPPTSALPQPSPPPSPSFSPPPSPALSPPPSPRHLPAANLPTQPHSVPLAIGFALATPPRRVVPKGKGKGKKGKGKGKRASDGEGPTQDPKRRKQGSLRPLVDSPSTGLPTDAPPWLVSSSSMLRSEDLGLEWMELVGIWESFEVSEGFDSPTKLPAKGRPPCISDWIQRARTPSYRPTITHPDTFAQVFSAWWSSLQPQWRKSIEGPLPRAFGDYDALRRPGVNGLLSVVAALFFWGTARSLNAPDTWLEMIDEVGWAVGQLVGTRAGEGSSTAP